jgi:hypothetical protein
MELYVTLSNGKPAQIRRLRFQFNPAETASVRLWLIKMPRLTNHETFPRQLTADTWELRSETLADTQPWEITDFTKEQARVWLCRIHRPQVGSGVTELLIMARGGLNFSCYTAAPTRNK